MRGSKISVFILFPHRFSFSPSFMLLSSNSTFSLHIAHSTTTHFSFCFFLLYSLGAYFVLCFNLCEWWNKKKKKREKNCWRWEKWMANGKRKIWLCCCLLFKKQFGSTRHWINFRSHSSSSLLLLLLMLLLYVGWNNLVVMSEWESARMRWGVGWVRYYYY